MTATSFRRVTVLVFVTAVAQLSSSSTELEEELSNHGRRLGWTSDCCSPHTYLSPYLLCCYDVGRGQCKDNVWSQGRCNDSDEIWVHPYSSTWTALSPAGYCRKPNNDAGEAGTEFTLYENVNSLEKCLIKCLQHGSNCKAAEYDYNQDRCEVWHETPTETNSAVNSNYNKNCLLKGDQLGVTNAGSSCYFACGNQQGPCPGHCGSGGYCCRYGFTPGNGCDGTLGIAGADYHACVSAPPAVSCAAYSLTDDVVGGSCTEGVVLTADTSCTINCATGYEGNGGSVSCPLSATEGQSPAISKDCTEIVCSAIASLPDDVVGGASSPCSVGLELSVHSNPECTLSCASGYYSGFDPAGTISCPASATSNSAPVVSETCVETECAPYIFTTGIEGDETVGTPSACVDGIRLTSQSNAACAVRCAEGYDGDPALVTCDSDASNGATAASTIACSENACAPLVFPDGITTYSDGEITACTESLELNTHSAPTECAITCAPGFSGDVSGTFSCDSSAGNGAEALVSISCAENSCAPLVLPEKFVGAGRNPCIDGQVLTTRSNAACEVACTPGFYVSGLSVGIHASCPSDASSDQSPVFVGGDCVESHCAPLLLPTGVVGLPTESGGCEAQIELFTRSNPTCMLTCDAGYDGGDAYAIAKCPRDATPGTEATINATCVERECAPFTFTEGMTGAEGVDPCFSGIVLTSVVDSECDVQCEAGYTASGSSAVVAVRCGIDGHLEESSDPFQCVENSCAPVSLGVDGSPYGLTPCLDNQILNTRSEPTSCTFLNTTTSTIMRAECPSGADNGSPAEIISANLTQVQCGMYRLRQQTRLVAGGTDPCYNRIRLTTVTDPECSVNCAMGYSGSGGVVTCVSTSREGDQPVESDDCVENKCQPLVLEAAGYAGTGSDPCVEGLELGTHTDSSCDVTCAPGYFGQAGTFTYDCESDASPSDPATTELVCYEVQCNPLSFDLGVISSDGADACVQGERLTTRTNPTCAVQCESGYSGDVVNVTCARNATFGQDADMSSVSCVENTCAEYRHDPGVGTAGVGGCVDGVRLKTRAPSSCNVVCVPGYSGNEGNVTCPFDADEGDPPVVSIVCTENACAPLTLPHELLSDPSDAASCFEGRTLLTSGSNRTCSTECVPGFWGSGATITCPSNAENGEEATISSFCLEVTCLPFYFDDGIVPDENSARRCVDGEELGTREDGCGIRCDAGYVGGTGMVSCPSDASFGTPPVSNLTCIENRCAAFNFPTGVSRGDTHPGPPITYGCDDGVSLGTHSTSTCTVQCSAGYAQSGSEIVSCPTNADDGDSPEWDISCTVNECSPVALPPGVVGSGDPPCQNGIVMLAHSDLVNETRCEASCGLGYYGLTGYMTCPSNAADDGETAPLWNGLCVEISCEAFTFGAGVEGASIGSDIVPCVDGVILTTETSSRCGVRCSEGYSGGEATVQCAQDASFGDDASVLPGTFRCTENRCSAFGAWPKGVRAGAGDGCSPLPTFTLSTHTDSSCALRCEPGYSGLDPQIVRCPIESEEGDPPLANISCIENTCATFHFADNMSAVSGRYDACYDGINLTTHTESRCVVSIRDGNMNTSAHFTVECAQDALDGDPVSIISGIVESVECAPVTFGHGVVASNDDVTGCIEDDSLISGTSCTLACASGFAEGFASVECPLNASSGDAPVIWTYDVVSGSLEVASSLNCTENYCSNKAVPTGYIVADDEPSCSLLTVGADLSAVTYFRLSAYSYRQCHAVCGVGYTGPNLTVSCASDADEGDDVEMSPPVPECRENRCAAISLVGGIVERDRTTVDGGRTFEGSCYEGQRLSTRTSSSCGVRCSSGYRFGESLAMCPSNSSDGTQPLVSLQCYPSVSQIRLACNSNDDCIAESMIPGRRSTRARRRRRELDSMVSDFGSLRCSGDFETMTTSDDDAPIVRVGTEGGSRIVLSNFTQHSGDEDVDFYLVSGSGDKNNREEVVSTYDSCDANRTTETLSCKVPAGVGVDLDLRLLRIRQQSDISLEGEDNGVVDTSLFDECALDYARPSISAIEGCGGNCSRSGGEIISIHGWNFGSKGALVFVNGQECLNATHGGDSSSCSQSSDSSICHRAISCILPPLTHYQSINTILIVQSSQFGSFYDFQYERCGMGYRQDPVTGLCSRCDAGRYSDELDVQTCEPCAVGKIAISSESSACLSCPSNFFAKDVGMTACEACPTGTSSGEGMGSCEDCDIFHKWSPGNCDVPVSGIILAILLCAIVVGLASFVWRRFARQKRKKAQLKLDLRQAKLEEEKRQEDIELLQRAWQIEWDQIKIIKKLAEGGGGIVYKGIMRNDLLVALKTISRTGNIEMMAQQEVRWMQRARHPRLVLFLGCGRVPDTKDIFVVLEFMERGDFLHHLVDGRESGTPPPWDERLRLLRDVADGMVYIHRALRSIHRDLKSENVLLSVESGALRAKVADFGLSRIMPSSKAHATHNSSSETKVKSFGSWGRNRESKKLSKKPSNSLMHRHSAAQMTTGNGTTAYMAPELFTREHLQKESDNYSQAVDVFAFAVILWEALEMDRAWKDVKWGTQIVDQVLEGKRLKIRDTAEYKPPLAAPPLGYVGLTRACWSQNPNHRPTFMYVAKSLSIISEKNRQSRIVDVSSPLAASHVVSTNFSSASSSEQGMPSRPRSPSRSHPKSARRRPPPLPRPSARSPRHALSIADVLPKEKARESVSIELGRISSTPIQEE